MSTSRRAPTWETAWRPTRRFCVGPKRPGLLWALRPREGQPRVRTHQRHLPATSSQSSTSSTPRQSNLQPCSTPSGGGVPLITEANNHGEDCGACQASKWRSLGQGTYGLPDPGMGENVTQAFTPYRATIHGERIVIIAATQVIDSDLQRAWTAVTIQPGCGVRLRHQLAGGGGGGGPQDRRHGDRVPALGTEKDRAARTRCRSRWLSFWSKRVPTSSWAPTPTFCLVADTWGSAYVDYGLGNFAFYDNSPPGERQRIAGNHGDGPPHRPV